MMRTSSKRTKKTEPVVVPVTEYVAPAPVKKPPPALFLFSNQIGLGRSFKERIA